jgi:S-adenosylmethionine hydrolase
MDHPTITLTTDFGHKDSYVAEMKAVILSISRGATIVDVSHEIEKFNTRMGAYVLACAAPYFPKGTIHVAVVDPGVGTARRALIAQTDRGFFVGPDNGVLGLALRSQKMKCVREITNWKLMMPRVSNTFHGRDIFAPVAAHLANGVPPSEFGPEIHDFVMPDIVSPVSRRGGVVGEVLHIDGFGNMVTNFSETDLEKLRNKPFVTVRFGKARLSLRVCRTYAEAKPHELLAIAGSHGFLEFSVNLGSASQRLKAKVGDEVVLRP